jgi:hypothetical protein
MDKQFHFMPHLFFSGMGDNSQPVNYKLSLIAPAAKNWLIYISATMRKFLEKYTLLLTANSGINCELVILNFVAKIEIVA